MDIGEIKPKEIIEEMQECYLDYAMSVIVGRALPDASDGLKPVHRRILYAMWDMGLKSTAKLRKSATVVGECFVKNTLISTEKGLLPIQDIKIGDHVHTQTGVKKVTELYTMPPRDLLKITLENGLKNTTTKSQMFKVLSNDLTFKWKKAEDLTRNDYLVVKNCYPKIKNPVKLGVFKQKQIFLNDGLAYMLGLFISDGWITKDYSKKRLSRLGFVATDRKILEYLQNTILKEFDYCPTIEEPKKGGGKEIYTLRINRNSINNFLVKVFQLENKWALTKEIPLQIFKSPAFVINSFLSGLIEGDGSVSQKRNLIHYGTISEKLANQLIVLLASQDILVSEYKSRKRNGNISGKQIFGRHILHNLEIKGENAIKLADKLNLLDKIKNEKIQRLKNKKIGSHDRKGMNKFDIIPYAAQVLFNELSAAHLGGGWYERTEGGKFRMGIKYPNGAKIRYSSDLQEKPLRTTQIVDWGIDKKLQEIGSPFMAFISSTIENNLHFIKIASINKQAKDITYDIEVEGEHEFLANGIVSHNCLGKYHPHGDVAVYDTMTRLAQDFSMRYPLIQGQGNWGSLDGDSPAAMRYTECRLTPIAEEMLEDIDKDTVTWIDNYDGTRQEPTVLPAKIPQLLLNGSMGIAVGMATSIPPHNLGELVDGITFLIENPKAAPEDLVKIIKGPDFPTGGAIYDRQAIIQAYSTGKGSIVNRAVAQINEEKKGGHQIIISEIPYQVNKASLLETIADLVKDKKVEGIRDIRDESDKDGVRIVIDLKNDSYPQKVLNRLYKLTDLQKSFHLNMLALTDGGLQPQVLPLKNILELFVEHRYSIVTRRSQFDLARAKERAHILEGLKKALDHIDAIISTIRKSADKDEAHKALCQKFKFSDAQAAAILEMRLATLAGLERQKIENELKEKMKLIAELEALLKSPKKILEVIKGELTYLKEKYGDERRTKVFASPVGEFKEEDLIAQEECIIALTTGGYIKRMDPKNYKAQQRGGKGITGITTREEDEVKYLASVSTHDNLLFFTSAGRVFQTKAYEIPEASRVARGQAIVNFLQLGAAETVSSMVALKDNPKTKKKEEAKTADGENYLVMTTKEGVIKKTTIDEFANVRRSGLIAIKLDKTDELRWVRATSGQDQIILVTAKGQSVRFKESDARPMGRGAGGVRGIKLKKDDRIVGMDIVKNDKAAKHLLLVVTENGYGKKTDINQFKLQRRGGSGIKAAQVTQKTGQIVTAKILDAENQDLIAMSQKGQVIRTPLNAISLLGRATQGVRIMKLEAGDKVASATCL